MVIDARYSHRHKTEGDSRKSDKVHKCRVFKGALLGNIIFYEYSLSRPNKLEYKLKEQQGRHYSEDSSTNYGSIFYTASASRPNKFVLKP